MPVGGVGGGGGAASASASASPCVASPYENGGAYPQAFSLPPAPSLTFENGFPKTSLFSGASSGSSSFSLGSLDVTALLQRRWVRKLRKAKRAVRSELASKPGLRVEGSNGKRGKKEGSKKREDSMDASTENDEQLPVGEHDKGVGGPTAKSFPTKRSWRSRGFGQEDSSFHKCVYDSPLVGRQVERRHADHLSVQEFISRYETPRVPVLIAGLMDDDDDDEQQQQQQQQQGRQQQSGGAKPTRRRPFALCSKDWQPERLLRRFANHKFKVGNDDDGYPVRVKFKHFYTYCRGELGDAECASADDSPLYVFDGTFANRGRGAVAPDAEGGNGLRGDYKVPSYFQEDLLKHAGRARPPYRWFVLGPPRSGSGCHVDPLATSAWNALILGHKRWALLPPETPTRLVKPPGVEREAATWFRAVLPRLRVLHLRKHGANKSLDVPDADSDDVASSLPPLTEEDVTSFTELHECIQHPGDVLYVPHGWHHAVLNGPDDFSVAVTQNYVSTANFTDAYAICMKKRPKMTKRWLTGLETARPDLAVAARGVEDDGTYSTSSSSSSSSSDSEDTEGSEDEYSDFS